MRSTLLVIFIIFPALGFRYLDAGSLEKNNCEYEFCVNPSPRLEAGYSFGQFIGINHNYAEIGLFVPIRIKNSLLPFVDHRLYKFDNNKWGMSGGLGIRKIFRNKCVLGSNIFYDYLEGRFNKSFNRLGLGLEWLGRSLDLRFNTYISLGNRTNFSKTVTYDDYVGDYHATCFEKQYSIGQGFDAEISRHFICCNQFTLCGGVGPYYYTSKKERNYFGGQLRIEANYNSLISIQIRSSYDSVNNSKTQGRIELTLPFEILCGKLKCLCNRAVLQPVKRNGIIFTDECCHYDWNW
jgi:Inverse autotransporter, beta-domain